ncbi:MAG: hypothetical protein RRY29_06500 [Desulfovibrionaceae bacterium]
MKKVLALVAIAVMMLSAVTCFAKSASKTEMGNPLPKYKYTLIDSFEVKGRQGITTDGDFYYVSGSKALYKYDKKGNLLASNENPFEGYAIPSNHIGDIDVFEGELFVSAENFMDGVGKDIQIAIHDAKTLKFKRSFKFDPASGQEEVSGVCVDRDKRTVWMCSWVGENSGRYLYEYSLDTGKYLRKVHLFPVPQWVQGVFYYEGALYVTADDGEADNGEADHLYRVDISGTSSAPVVLETTFTQVKFLGEVEGLAIDSKTHELLVHFNRGARIVLGMGKGFYPGYDREISEIYRFKMTPVKWKK